MVLLFPFLIFFLFAGSDILWNHIEPSPHPLFLQPPCKSSHLPDGTKAFVSVMSSGGSRGPGPPPLPPAGSAPGSKLYRARWWLINEESKTLYRPIILSVVLGREREVWNYCSYPGDCHAGKRFYSLDSFRWIQFIQISAKSVILMKEDYILFHWVYTEWWDIHVMHTSIMMNEEIWNDIAVTVVALIRPLSEWIFLFFFLNIQKIFYATWPGLLGNSPIHLCLVYVTFSNSSVLYVNQNFK